MTKNVTLKKKKDAMKTVRFFKPLLITVLLTLFMASCSVHTSSSHGRKLPPGQAKKMSGSKSAKAYAPGQQKKR